MKPQKILRDDVPAAPERALAASAPECASFVHLHVGFDASGLDLPATGAEAAALRIPAAHPSAPAFDANVQRALSPRPRLPLPDPGPQGSTTWW